MIKVAIVDYSIGNLFSVFQACKKINVVPFVTSDPEDLDKADAIILPGVGAFAQGIQNLDKMGLSEVIISNIKKGKPFLGICLGMQLLLESSEEFGLSKGLGVISGKVKALRGEVGEDLPVPKITWSPIYKGRLNWESSPLQSVIEGEDFYFVHSYYCDLADELFVLSYSEYGTLRYCSSILKENIFATQFHPEKSASSGIKIYEDWKNFYFS